MLQLKFKINGRPFIFIRTDNGSVPNSCVSLNTDTVPNTNLNKMNTYKLKSRSQAAINFKSFLPSSVRHTSRTALFLAAVTLVGSVHGATIADFGTTDPTATGSDVSQFGSGNNRDGLNYYSDNAASPGQTFTTGSNPSGYGLPSLYVKTGGYDANSTATLQTYTLRIYSVSGSTATLISTYTTDNLLGFTDGAWLRYSGLTNILQPNSVYAYTHHRNGNGWDGMGCTNNNPYAGGEICLIPSAGGAITFGPNHTSDAAFMANLLPITDPFVFDTQITPSSAIGGTSVTINAGVASGTAPLRYQWRFTGTNGTSLIPNATNITYTIASVSVTNQGSYSLIVSNGLGSAVTNTPASLSVRAAYNISTIGTTPPVTGVYDIAQLTVGADLDGLNYFSDNGNPPGQTFTTAANPAGYTLTAIYLKTAGVNSGQTGTPKTYTLRLYTISGSTATLISTYISDNTVGFTDGDWLRYTGMTNVLQPNTIYAYTHKQNGAGWDQMSAVLGDVYANGQACLIPTAGGAVTFGTGPLDATFQVSMVPNGFPAIQNVTISPANNGGNPVYVPSPVTLNVQASGATPLYYQWQTDNGLGGAFSNIANSNTNSYSFSTIGMTPGTYQYQVVVTNVNNSATSSVVVLNLSAASSPFLVTDTAIAPAAAFAGDSIQLSAAFQGSLPITYQWMFNNGSGAVPIAGATAATYTISSAQLTNAGTYYLAASNAVSPFVSNSTPANLSVASQPQQNSTSGALLDATSTPPTPGTYDIAQLITVLPSGNQTAFNYYVDNGNPPGQTFTTLATSPSGYVMNSVYFQHEFDTFGGNGGNWGSTNSTYTLGIYSVSGTNTTLLTAYSSTNAPDLINGDWMQFVGVTNVLAPSSTYAFSIKRNTGGGWWKLANDNASPPSADLYAGGLSVLLPGSGLGAMTLSPDATVDTGFMVALTPAVGGAPTLSYTRSGNTLVFTVPSGFKLQAQTNSLAVGITSTWADYPGGGPGAVNATVNPANGTVFYRLKNQ